MADCSALWQQLAEMFGAKALEAKFGLTPPDLWRQDVGRLNQFELDRGVRRIKSSGTQHLPTLPQFLRLCREVTSEFDPVQPRSYTNTSGGAALPRWVETANMHLLGYIASRTWQRNRFTGDNPQLMQVLVDAKNNWAEQMREWERDDQLPADHGRALWNEMMTGCEKSIAALLRVAA